MKRMMVVLALTMGVSGCLTVHTPSGTQRFVLPQVGVVLRVVNNCAPFLDIWAPTGLIVMGLPYGEVSTVPLVSQSYSGRTRKVEVTVQGYTKDREYLGSDAKSFTVRTSQGSYQETWEVARLRLPNRRGGCI